jgi:hypothetical protein
MLKKYMKWQDKRQKVTGQLHFYDEMIIMESEMSRSDVT